MKRVVIIGGGITGLAAAHRLHELNSKQTATEVILLEAGSRLGGIIQTEQRNQFLIEHGPDSFISEKPAALELAKRIGLEPRLIPTNERYRKSFVVCRGKLLSVPEGFHLLAPSRLRPFLASEIFSWTGKARMTMEMFLPSQTMNGQSDESLASFVRRRLGNEALERMAQPMVGGIYTANPERLSLRATFPRFLDWEQNYGSVIRALRRAGNSRLQSGDVGEQSVVVASDTSGARYSLFLSFAKGMQQFTDKLTKHLGATNVQLNSPVRRLGIEGKRWTITTDRESLAADGICLTTPAYISAELLRDTDKELAETLREIEYESSGTINLAYRREDVGHRLDGFGFVVPFIEGRSLIACTFSSVKFADRAPADHVLLRAFVGGALHRDIFQLEEKELLKRVINDLNELLQIKAPPIFTTLARWERSMPQYHVGHLQQVQKIRRFVSKLEGLELAGGAYSGVGIPDCVKSGEAAAEKIRDQLFGVR
jgi:oxygen-dependent protoporphyrinogen oxidase